MKRTRIKNSVEISPVTFPLQNSDAHNGFVNSKNNPWGLKAEFFVEENNTCRCEWTNTHTNFQGFANIIHGGILATLADELMANNVLGSLNKFAMSLKAELEWQRPAKVSEKITGRSQIYFRLGSFVLVRFELLNEKQKPVLTGTGVFYLLNRQQFERATSQPLPPELIPYVRP
ncbi:PaaI family thioesterase [Bdellovibrio sp. HCB337]|uniref:PaaI family thioesterase n=1 Tax=Bdellovibrio sp. HCB337 TaxID=3394358 RepID=UPI0039A688F3